MYHFHITMDCCWTHLTLGFDISNRTLLMMGSSGPIVFWCPMKHSTSTSPNISPIAVPQKAYHSMLQMAWSCSRTPEACIVILPVVLAIRHCIFLTTNTSNTIRSVGLYGPRGAICTVTWTFPTQSWLLSVSLSTWSSICIIDLECVASRSQTDLPGTVFPSLW